MDEIEQFYGDRIVHQLNFTKEIFYLKGDPENSNFDKVELFINLIWVKFLILMITEL